MGNHNTRTIQGIRPPRRIAFLVALVLAFAAVPVRSVLAETSPHQQFLGDVANCSACHRSHGGAGATLQPEPGLCLSCHGHNATGATTDVEWGVIRGTNTGLKGGGFASAFMDTALTGTPVASAVTSAHDVSGTNGTAWGYGGPAAIQNAGISMSLRCSSCHDPHGNGNYRSLRTIPLGLPDGGGREVSVAPGTSQEYGVTYAPDHRREVSHAPENIGDWCAQCHSRYAEAGLGASGDVVFAYRHNTAVPGQCLACHVAHGTSAVMGRYSGDVNLPDGRAGSGRTDSRLLAVDGRGVCTGCHAAQTSAN